MATKAAKIIDGAIYSLAPDWWDEHYPTINPETWKTITTENDLGSSLFRAVFELNDDNTTTMYLDEKALAYTYAMMLENGFWNSGSGYESDDTEVKNVLVYPNFYPNPLTSVSAPSPIYMRGTSSPSSYGYVVTVGDNSSTIYALAVAGYGTTLGNYGSTYALFLISANQFKYARDWVGNVQTATPPTPSANASLYTTRKGTNFYGVLLGTSDEGNYPDILPVTAPSTGSYSGIDLMKDAATIIFDGDTTEISSVPGVSDNPEAGYPIVPTTIINQTTGQPVTPQDDIDDIVTALRLAYPQLFDGEIYDDVVQPDGSIDRHYYVPTPYPDMEDPTKPVTDTTPGVDPQTNPEYNPETRPEEQTQGLTDSLTENPTQQDTGSGTTPPFVPPSGTANALYAIYNPSQGELNSFGAWLWSSNFVDQLLKLFNDPMQAIIGLHKVFVSPVISGRQNIKVGYLDSGVASNVVGAQYVTVDCGSVTIPEYFGNVFDYDPFTQIYLYLPFVGIQRLDTGDVMRSTLNVIYHCDVLTGACLVEVNVLRDGGGGVIYTYTGNCAVQYPISSGSYMGIIASLASVVGGVVGTIATGGALAPVALGAVSGVMNAHTRVEHSGGFSGNAGAMGIKKPYVIITRPQTCLADNFPAYNGYPANKLTYVGECSGYIRCDECHVEQVPGTDAELSELESLLKSGIII